MIYHGSTGTYYQGMTGSLTGTTGGQSSNSIGISDFSIDNSIRAGYEQQPINHVKNISRRFYQKLLTIMDDEENWISKSKHFFDLSSQITKDPVNILEPNEYYMYALALFYFREEDTKTNEIWLRMKTLVHQIYLSSMSGSVYQSPFDYDNGMIYFGTTETDGHCFVTEKDKSIIFLSPYYFTRTKMIHCRTDSLLMNKLETIIPKVSQYISKYILDGTLSDSEIVCSNGTVKISKCMLANRSSYFFYLFTNGNFKKQENYQLDFNKKILEYYILYCCAEEAPFDDKIVTEMIQFGDFIQDKNFLQYYYKEIYTNQHLFTRNNLLEIMRIYQDMDL